MANRVMALGKKTHDDLIVSTAEALDRLGMDENDLVPKGGRRCGRWSESSRRKAACGLCLMCFGRPETWAESCV